MFKLLWEEKAPDTVETFIEEMSDLESEITCFLLAKGYSRENILVFAENVLVNVSEEECELIVTKVLENN